MYQDYRENIGSKKVGFLRKIHLDGFSGIADLQMEEEFLILMRYKLRDGKILEDTYWQLKKIVKRVILGVEEDKDKPFYNGPIIPIDKKY